MAKGQEVSLENVQEVVNLESKQSLSSQQSMEDIPDFLNCSFDTLQRFAAMSNQDHFIFGI